MLHLLRRHPFPVRALFRHSLVLTYAWDESRLQALLPPGLAVDSYEGKAFLAIALVATEQLRPAGLPAAFGRRFFLSGYRIFSRYRQADGRTLRGLFILRSDTDSRTMTVFGNLLTHYRYRLCRAEVERTADALTVCVTTPGAEADLSVRASTVAATAPPAGSPFPDLIAARRFAGPLPFTFDYEAQTRRMVIIEGVRSNWDPLPVRVEVSRCTFFAKPPFAGTAPRLAAAFLVENVRYRWRRGVLAALPKGAA